VPPLAPAKVLRTDASVPTRRRSLRAPRAGVSTAAAAGESSQGAAEASRPRPADRPVVPQPAAVEERRAPVAVEAQPVVAAVVEAQPATPTEEGGRAPAVVGARPEAVATAPRQAPAATEARAEASTEATQGPAPAGGSWSVVVEIPDDDSPPPGWDPWASFPTLSPES
jgi:hypothetical protein